VTHAQLAPIVQDLAGPAIGGTEIVIYRLLARLNTSRRLQERGAPQPRHRKDGLLHS
jgi:hypothetical protein